MRLKYPEVYHLIYRNKHEFLTAPDDLAIVNVTESNDFYIRFKGESTDIENSLLYMRLNEKPEKYALNSDEVLDVVQLFSTIFQPKHQFGGFQKNRTLRNNHFSIIHSVFFNRYFDHTLEGRLLYEEFENALELSLADLKSKIENWNLSQGASTDLTIYLENLKIVSSRDQFEKVIQAILHFADLPVPQNPQYSNMFDAANFMSKLGRGNDQFNPVLQNLYNNDYKEFYSFFKSLIITDPPIIRWRFIHEFSKTLISEYADGFIIPKSDLRALIRDSFISAAESITEFSNELMEFYRQAVQQFRDPHDMNNLKPIGDGIRMTSVMRELIRKDISNFLDWCFYSRNPGSNKYLLTSWHNVIFEVEEFEHLLEEQSSNPKVQEFLKFYNKYKANQTSTEQNNSTEFNFVLFSK
jgi:hypothetical protein